MKIACYLSVHMGCGLILLRIQCRHFSGNFVDVSLMVLIRLFIDNIVLNRDLHWNHAKGHVR